MNIRRKMTLTTNLLLLVTILILSGAALVSLTLASNKNIKELHTVMEAQYNQTIKEHVQILISELDGIQKQVEAGTLDAEAAKLVAADVIRNAKYGESGYFWADDLEGNNIVLLGKKETEGTNRLELTDKKGVKIVQEFMKIAKTSGEGYLDYYFPKPNETEASLKRGYVQLYKPYNWVIGTGNYIDDIDKAVTARERVQKAAIQGTMFIMLGVAIVILLIGVVFATAFSRTISTPIMKVTHYINRLGKLEIADTQEITPFRDRKDEIGQITNSVEVLSSELKRVLGEMQGFSGDLSNYAKEMSEISAVTSENTNAVVSAVDEFARGAQDQANDAQVGAANLRELNGLLTKSSKEAQLVSDLAIEGKTVQESGNQAIKVLVKSFEETMTITKVLSQDIGELSNHTKAINAIIDTIEGIAAQTNLLALNASIEAARAGEAGKGFAVVASEIRNLAEQTQNSTKQINAIIHLVTQSVNSSTGNMQKSNTAISDASTKLSEVEEAIEKTLLSSRKSFESVEQLKQIYSKINTSKDLVVSSIESISAVTEENAAAAEEINASMETQKSAITNLDTITQEVSENILKLSDLIEKFKI